MNTSTPQLDSFDHEVTFGPAYAYELFFDPSHPHHVRLPSRPPISGRYETGERCGCESCRTEGWYVGSPMCRFWRSHCEACDGQRTYRVYLAPGTWREEVCELCQSPGAKRWPGSGSPSRTVPWPRASCAMTPQHAGCRASAKGGGRWNFPNAPATPTRSGCSASP
ncbi:hypothetical protein [Parasphingorhabdus pacifica]